MNDGLVYAGPEGTITATSTGYIVEDDGGEVEGEFVSLTDAHAALGSTPPAYPDAVEGPGTPVADAEPMPDLHLCEHCGLLFTDLRPHLSEKIGTDRDSCPVLFGPADDFADVRAGARAQRDMA